MRGYMWEAKKTVSVYCSLFFFFFWFPAGAHAGGEKVSCIGVWGVGKTASGGSRRKGDEEGGPTIAYTKRFTYPSENRPLSEG